MAKTSAYDAWTILGLLVAFALPLSLLVPGLSVCDAVPKVRVIRFHVYSQELSWNQLNATMVSLMILFFCLYLEIKKRRMDDMVETVLTVSQATEKTMEVERQRQMAAVRACVELLDASAEHYEHLVLLRDELRHRKHQPPVIEPSESSMQLSSISDTHQPEETRVY